MVENRTFVEKTSADNILRNNEYLRYNIHKKDENFKTHVLVNNGHYAYDLSPSVYSLGELVDAKAINNSIMNILLTKRGELIFEPSIGSSIMSYLFENYGDTQYASDFLDKILSEIRQIETRIVISKEMCSLAISAKDHSLELKIVYVVKNTGKMGVFDEEFIL